MTTESYERHIICGTAIALGASGTTFFKRFFGLKKDMVFCRDERPPSQIYIPKSEDLRPASFLGRRSWAQSVGALLYKLALSTQQSLVVTLHATPIADALTNAFKVQETHLGHQVLSPRLGWTTAKIAERLADLERSTMTIISPRLRGSILDGPVDIEATGPMLFLNQRDPLVAAQIRVFAQLYKDEGPITTYLLPQALLELKTRISSQAKVHIILDSALRAKVYRDEVLSLFKEGEILDTLPGVTDGVHSLSDSFSDILLSELERQGFSTRTNVSEEDLYLMLQTLWQTGSFRKSPLDQEDIVRKVLDGKDQLVVAATGGGKSLCFQLPAVLIAQDVVPRVTLVFSPLIALMSDQVDELRRKGIFSAIALNSTLSNVQRQDYLRGLKQGDYSIVYMAPEQIRSSALRHALENREVGLIAFDEAHCVSQWGHNFRTDYFAIKKWVDTQISRNQKPPMLALTATARKGYKSEKSTIEDIIEKLGLHIAEDDVVMTSPERQELEFHVEQIITHCPTCNHALEMKIGTVKCLSCGREYYRDEIKEKVRQAKLDKLVSFLTEPGEMGIRQRWERVYGQRQRGLIYCAYKITTEQVADVLRSHPQLKGLRVGVYHGGMSDEARDKVYKRFISDDKNGLDVVVATNAFGMGIDIRRLGFVIHFDTPATPEAYYQEAGRAGRDPEFKEGKHCAQCILLYHENDLAAQRRLSNQNKITREQIENVYAALCKLRHGEEQKILATEHEIARLANVDENMITPILYYLEYHTQANGKSILERGESASRAWQLKFEQGYQHRIEDPAISLSSRQLIDVFLTSDKFCLGEKETVTIDANDLALHMGWEMAELEGEKENLVMRHIIVHASHIYVQWTKCRSEAYEVVEKLGKDIVEFLYSVKDQEALGNGEKVYANLRGFYEEGDLKTVPLSIFTNFLSHLAKTSAGSLQLFEHFGRATRYPRPGYYELQLKPFISVPQIRNQLYRTIRRFAYDTASNEWQAVDMLREAPDYEERQLLKQQFIWLKELDLLSFLEEPKRDVPMCITFKQGRLSTDQLWIDLSSLRLSERYGEKKLEVLREYATIPQEQRLSLLNTYFFGERPLI